MLGYPPVQGLSDLIRDLIYWAAQVAALYTPNGQVFPPGNDVATGPQAIQVFWQAVMDMGITHARLETVDLEQHNDTAIEVGRYTLSGADGQVVDTGKYVVIWKESGGRWQLHRDIWNSSRAEPAQ
jgi:ketosteroid isomerase-like protein